MNLRKLISFSLAILLIFTSANAHLPKYLEGENVQAESAVLLNRDGTPRCRIGSTPELGTLRVCDKGDERAISTLGIEEANLGKIFLVIGIIVTGIAKYLEFQKQYEEDWGDFWDDTEEDLALGQNTQYLLIAAGENPQSVNGFSTGDIFKVQKRREVSLLPLWSDDLELKFGDNCSMEIGGEAKILGFTEDQTQALIEYISSGSNLETQCSTGDKFFLDISLLEAL